MNNEKKLKEWIEAAPERDAAAKRCVCRDSCCRCKLRSVLEPMSTHVVHAPEAIPDPCCVPNWLGAAKRSKVQRCRWLGNRRV